MFRKDGLSTALEYDLSYIIRKDDIFFPKNIILFFRQKMKDDLCQKKKIHGYVIFSSNVLKKWSSQVRINYDISVNMLMSFTDHSRFLT